MIRIDHLQKTYDRYTRHANKVLHDVSLTLPDTGFVCILGPSGCGKTSLLNAIGGLDDFDSGSIQTDNARITRSRSRVFEQERNASFGYIFQNYYLLGDHSAAYNVYLGMHSLPLSKAEKSERVRDALARVDMLRFHKRRVHELSGGQQQRIAIARAIARRPRVIFADEPTGNLDDANTMNICSILKELSRESLILMVTHEERIARFFADRIITLEQGHILSDITDWKRTEMDVGKKDTIYAKDYNEDLLNIPTLSLRLLQENGAPPTHLTIISEQNRLVIKVDDPRAVLCSETASAPFVEEAARPHLCAEQMIVPEPTVSQTTTPSLSKKDKRFRCEGIGFAIKEGLALVAEKRLKKLGTGIFIILLTLMLAISIADVITVAHIDPEDFITADSHVLDFHFSRGEAVIDRYQSITPYLNEFKELLKSSDIPFYYLPYSSAPLTYRDDTIPQFGSLTLEFGHITRASLSSLAEDRIIAGRFPNRSDEIVIDRWVLDKILSEDGVLQNLIPDRNYLLGKTLTSLRKTFSLTIVGICDSGEPSIYMSTEAQLAFGICGTEIITLSEYKRLTNDETISSLLPDECVVLTDNVPNFNTQVSVGSLVGSNYLLRAIDVRENTRAYAIGAKLVIADDALDPLYRTMIDASEKFYVYSTQKEELTQYLKQKTPEELRKLLSIEMRDRYGEDYTVYEEKTSQKLDTRTIVIFSTLLLSALMLYLMQ